MNESIEKLINMVDIRLAKELGEGRWTTDSSGDKKYTEEAQDRFMELTELVSELRNCYWDIHAMTVISSEEELSNRREWDYTPQGTKMWVLVGRYSGYEDDVYLFTSEELAKEGLKLLYRLEYSVYKQLGLDMTFVEFLKEFCDGLD